ncbi:MAG: response regulator [Deltaproteobacteria bacterium]|nr:response regulator [Deltaproteobacteria bacterium]
MTPPLKILIIDDEEDLLAMLNLSLKNRAFEVEVAKDGQLGLSKALSFKPNIILLDLVMPGIDGWEVCQKLKTDPKTKSIPIIVFTALQSSEAKETALSMGADAVILKPCDNDELVQTINKLAGKNKLPT